jgi:ribonuclease P protein component
MPYKKLSFGKSEKLCSKKLIQELFSNQDVHRIGEHPFLLLWKKVNLESEYPVQVLIIVSKKLFPKATDRNRIRRQLRELYRLNKTIIFEMLHKQNEKLALVLMYKANTKLDMFVLHTAYSKLIEKLVKNIEQSN